MSVPARLDFATYSPRGAPRVMVEAKRLDRDPEWATAWRRNLFEYRPEGLAEVTLALVTLSRIFVWPVGAAPDAPPTQVLDARPHLQPYFERLELTAESISGHLFERVVSGWLEDLTNPYRVEQLPPAIRRELEQCGLLAALHDTRLVEEGSARW